MAKPSAPSVGTRILYYAAVAPAPPGPDKSYVGGDQKVVQYYSNPALAIQQPGEPGLPNVAGPYCGLVTLGAQYCARCH
jgi:hypothetical protein